MSPFPRRAVALTAAGTLALTLSLAMGATAAPGPRPGPPPDVPALASKSDADGDKIADDLEAALETLAPGDRVAVIVQGTTPGEARRAAPSFQVDQEFTIIPAFSGSVNGGQVTALAAIPWVTRVELDGEAIALDAAGDRDFGVQAARSAGLAGDGTLDGDGVGICIIDTGIDPNQEQLSGRITGWKDWVNNRTTAYDDHGHGTHVAGIAAGDGTGSATADAYGGVARGASLVAATVLNSQGSGSDANVVSAIQWCAARADVRIISMSLGSGPSDGSDASSQAVDAATDAGKVVVVAAGNSGDQPGSVSSPGVATTAVTVGAVADYSAPSGDPGQDPGLTLAGFSSRGPTDNPAARQKPDVVAPGVTVVAAKSGTTSGYVAYSGTSMATPFVAGVVALGLEVVPAATSAQVKAALQTTAVDAGVPGADGDWGYGLIDARAFVDALRGVSPTHAAYPAHVSLISSVPNNGSTDVPIQVATAGQPLGVSVLVDVTGGCTLFVLGMCWSYDFSPDLDAVLLDPSGTEVARSECPLDTSTGFCGEIGRSETLGVTSAAAGTWTVRVFPFDGTGGTFRVDAYGGLEADPPPPPDNRAPTANAGPDQTLHVGRLVTLDGSGSSDPDLDTLSFSWQLTTRPTGSTATLQGATTAQPTFTSDKTGTYVATLTVSDGRGGTASATVSITTTNTAPTANAGPDGTVKVGRSGKASFTLDGSNSSDLDGDALTYSWVLGGKVVGTKSTLSQSKSPGTYTYTLTVRDPYGLSATDSVTVTVTR